MTLYCRTCVGLLASALASIAPSAPASQNPPQPRYKITIDRTFAAVNYRSHGSARVDFRGTTLAFQAVGEARVIGQRGAIRIDVHFDKLSPASDIGPECLTYVLWAISPEGRVRNLGEVVLKGREGRLTVTTSLQTFAMMLTAEPYFAVSMPSDLVVAQNVFRRDSLGSQIPIEAKCELLHGDYTKADLQHVNINSKIPLDLYQARNAVQIAKSAGADRYSPDSLAKSKNALQKAERYQSRKDDNRRLVIATARKAVRAAEDARVIAGRRSAEELALTH